MRLSFGFSVSFVKNPLLTISGARLGYLALRDGSGAGCARVSDIDHDDHDRARAVRLHAHDRTGRGRAAGRSRFHGLWPDLRAGPRCGRRFQWRRCDHRPFARPLPAAPRDSYAAAPAQAAYAEPAPVRYDASYHLDAGDKLRVVVYGQEGLTNTYAIDAAGSITVPLIGSVPARGRTPAGLAAEISGQAARRLYSRSLGRSRNRSLPAFLHPRRSRSPRAISLCAEHDGRECGRDCRRLLAARPA